MARRKVTFIMPESTWAKVCADALEFGYNLSHEPVPDADVTIYLDERNRIQVAYTKRLRGEA